MMGERSPVQTAYRPLRQYSQETVARCQEALSECASESEIVETPIS